MVFEKVCFIQHVYILKDGTDLKVVCLQRGRGNIGINAPGHQHCNSRQRGEDRSDFSGCPGLFMGA